MNASLIRYASIIVTTFISLHVASLFGMEKNSEVFDSVEYLIRLSNELDIIPPEMHLELGAKFANKGLSNIARVHLKAAEKHLNDVNSKAKIYSCLGVMELDDAHKAHGVKNFEPAQNYFLLVLKEPNLSDDLKAHAYWRLGSIAFLKPYDRSNYVLARDYFELALSVPGEIDAERSWANFFLGKLDQDGKGTESNNPNFKSARARFNAVMENPCTNAVLKEGVLEAISKLDEHEALVIKTFTAVSRNQNTDWDFRAKALLKLVELGEEDLSFNDKKIARVDLYNNILSNRRISKDVKVKFQVLRDRADETLAQREFEQQKSKRIIPKNNKKKKGKKGKEKQPQPLILAESCLASVDSYEDERESVCEAGETSLNCLSNKINLQLEILQSSDRALERDVKNLIGRANYVLNMIRPTYVNNLFVKKEIQQEWLENCASLKNNFLDLKVRRLSHEADIRFLDPFSYEQALPWIRFGRSQYGETMSSMLLKVEELAFLLTSINQQIQQRKKEYKKQGKKRRDNDSLLNCNHQCNVFVQVVEQVNELKVNLETSVKKEIFIKLPSDTKNVLGHLSAKGGGKRGTFQFGSSILQSVPGYNGHKFDPFDVDVVIFDAHGEADCASLTQTYNEKLYRGTVEGQAVELLLADDNFRPDLGIAGILVDQTGKVWDFSGHGLSDVKDLLIQAIGDPIERIVNDPITILRTLKYRLLTGFTIEAKLEQALRSWQPKESINFEHFWAVYNKEHERFGKEWENEINRHGALQRAISKVRPF